MWACCAMQCVLRQGMGQGDLARERSQVIPVEGSSHVALLKIELHWRGSTEDWRHVWTQGGGCHLTSLLSWSDELLCNLGEVLFLLRPLLLSVTALCKKDLPGDDCMRTDLQGCPLQPPEGKFPRAVTFMFLWPKSPTVHHEFSRWSQWGSLVILFPCMCPPPQEPTSCLAQRPGKTTWFVQEWASCNTPYFASSSSHYRGPIVLPL